MKTRKILAAVLTFIFFITGIVIFKPESGEVHAADTSVVEDVMNVKCQVTEGTDAGTTSPVNMRLVASVDCLENYSEAGFEIYYNGTDEPSTATPIIAKTSTVYKRIVASATSGVDYNYSAKVISTDSEYFVTVTLLNISRANFDKPFYIKPFCKTIGGDTVYGVSRYVKVSDSYNNIINLPVRATEAQATGMTVDYNTTKLAQVPGYDYDGTYAHLKFQVNDGQTLSSLTSFEVKDSEGTTIDIVTHRNLTTEYNGDGIGDTSWYTEALVADGAETEFVIATNADLYGLLSKSTSYNFALDKIYVVSDITVNKGNATGWATTAPDSTMWWTPINGFAGTFDGQGHTISGLYGNSDTDMGLFVATVDSTEIQDLKVKNSYFETAGNEVGLSAVSGSGHGTFKDIYVDAILVKTGGYDGKGVGGILGFASASTGTATIENCWSNCTIQADGKRVAGILGSANTSHVTVSVKHCLNTGTITYTGTSQATYRFFGGIVGATGNNGSAPKTGSFTMDDCLNIGTVTTNGGTLNAKGAIIGQVEGTITVTNTYGLDTSASGMIGMGSASVSSKTADQLSGNNAKKTTALDFDNYWSAAYGAEPILTTFADDTDLLWVDTTWFDTTTNKGTIKTRNQLYGFASLAASGKFDSNSKVYLGADITVNQGKASEWATTEAEYAWTPINAFAGTFDGKGHTISGLYGESDASMGLFTATTSTTQIENLKVTNSYFETSVSGLAAISGVGHGTFKNIYTDVILVGTGGDNYGAVGGILGEATTKTANATVTIENCWSNCQIKADGKRVGGILGSGNASDVTVSIKHCLNTGTITHTSATDGWRFFGGIVGATGSAADVNKAFTMDDCLNTGTITTSGGTNKAQGAIIGQAGGVVNITNTYALNTSINNNLTLGHGSPTGTVSMNFKTTSELKGDNATNTTLDFVNYWFVVDGTAPMLKTFADLFWVDATWFNITTNSGTIMTRNQLYGFAALVADGRLNSSSKVYLGADITLNQGVASDWATTVPEYAWTPINAFAGTFDGKGHTISGLYGKSDASMGLFTATTSTTQIENLKVTNSYFETSVSGLAAISGVGHGTFKNIYADVILVGTGGDNYGAVGGILGEATTKTANAIVTIENCWSNCQIKADGKRVGGILGSGNASDVTVSIKHCLNTGTITHTSVTDGWRFFGGIVGATGSAADVNKAFTMDDCLNMGTMTTSGGANKAQGAIIGQAGGIVAITNTYALNTSINNNLTLGNGSPTGTVSMSFKTASELKGISAKLNTTLDWNYWSVAGGTIPILKTFAKTSDDTDSLLIDTTWFDTTTNSGTITTTNQLYGFIFLANNKKLDSSSKVYLGADIAVNQSTVSEWITDAPDLEWVPISGFEGTFNGQGHTISGLYGKSDTDMGLFITTSDTTEIQNLKVTNSYFETTGNAVGLSAISGSGHGTFKNIYTDATLVKASGSDGNGAGGIVGCASASTGTVIIENCWSNCTIQSDGKRVGGILGSANTSHVAVSVKHCLNTGTVLYTGTSTATYRFFGGLVGATGNNGASPMTGSFTMDDCLNVGTVTTNGGTLNAKGAIIGQVEGTITVTNTYGLDTSASGMIGMGSASVSSKTADQLDGNNAKKTTALDFANYWSTVYGTTPVLKTFADDMDLLWLDTTWFDSTENSGTIMTKNQLYGFAALATDGTFNSSSKVCLGADITVNQGTASDWATKAPSSSTWWTPINNFVGAFDGQGHAISGLYGKSDTAMGLFTTTTSTTQIENLKVTNSYFETSVSGLSAISGTGHGTFKNIYADAILVGTGGDDYGAVGGILGEAKTTTGTVTIENCWSNCTIQSDGKRVGGILGSGNASVVIVSIKHCLNTGTLTHTSTTDGWRFFGGLVGATGSAADADKAFTMDDCLNVGTVTTSGGANKAQGAILGQAQGTLTITNTYALDTSASKLVGHNTTSVAVSAKTIEQLEGDNAKKTTALDFVNYWTTVTGTTPVLQSFVREAYLSDSDNFTPSWNYDFPEEMMSYENKVDALNAVGEDARMISVFHMGGDIQNYPKNSIEALISAIQMGADVVEVDLVKTADGHIVLMHDETLSSYTDFTSKQGVNGLPTDDNATKWTLAELRQLRLKNPDGTISGYVIPTLEEALTVSNGRVKIVLDKIFNSYYMPVLDWEADIYPIIAATEAWDTWILPYHYNVDTQIAIVNALETGAGVDNLNIHAFVKFGGNVSTTTGNAQILRNNGITPIAYWHATLVTETMLTESEDVLSTLKTSIRIMGQNHALAGGTETSDMWDKLWSNGVNMVLTDKGYDLQQYIATKFYTTNQ